MELPQLLTLLITNLLSPLPLQVIVQSSEDDTGFGLLQGGGSAGSLAYSLWFGFLTIREGSPSMPTISKIHSLNNKPETCTLKLET